LNSLSSLLDSSPLGGSLWFWTIKFDQSFEPPRLKPFGRFTMSRGSSGRWSRGGPIRTSIAMVLSNLSSLPSSSVWVFYKALRRSGKRRQGGWIQTSPHSFFHFLNSYLNLPHRVFFIYYYFNICSGFFFNLWFVCFHPCGRDSSIIWMLLFFIHPIYVLFCNQTMGCWMGG
jgi:hypothetical protein